jgi:hypothetical protein
MGILPNTLPHAQGGNSWFHQANHRMDTFANRRTSISRWGPWAAEVDLQAVEMEDLDLDLVQGLDWGHCKPIRSLLLQPE